ncbi:MAG TPA: pyrrolo-quinoline quinone [Planctomycetaceae bacterium]|jgi:outer membrane protein assembly factor BamB|nr:pyrrolo-quinoline quinone [Planctomycetaceae bacterium]
MPVVRCFLLVALAWSCCLPAVEAQGIRRSVSPLIPESSLNRLGLTREWWGHAVTNRQRDRITHLTADEFLVVAQSSSGITSAFDAETGRLKWYTLVGAVDAPAYAGSFNDDYVFVISGARLTAINRDKGDVAFTFPLPSQPSAPVAVNDDQIFLGCLDGSLYAFDLKQVLSLHQQGRLNSFIDAAQMWRYRTSERVTSPPIIQGSNVLFASKNGSVYSLAALNRKMAFQFETDAALSAPIARYKDLMILASEDYNVYAIDTRSGRMAWQFTTGHVIKKDPLVINDDLFVIPEYGRLYRVNAATGERLWAKPDITQVLTASPTRLYTVDNRGHLRVLDRKTGDTVGSVPLGTFSLRVVNFMTDRIYLGTESGLVMAVREQGAEFPNYYRRPELQPMAPGVAPKVPAPKSDISDDNAPPDADPTLETDDNSPPEAEADMTEEEN